jgi:branched-chain amino acid transport system permease protein
MFLLLGRTRFGLALRAASEGPITASMLGINVPRMQTAVWALAGALAAVSSLLISAHYYLDPTFLTAFKLGSFAAIVLGGMESIAGLAVGAVLFGLVSSTFAYFVTARLISTLNFIAITVILAVFPYGIFGRRLERVAEPRIGGDAGRLVGTSAARVASGLRASIRQSPLRYLSIVVAGIVLVALPTFTSDLMVYVAASIAAMFVAAAGLNIISGYAGQGSLGQSGFIAIGAYAFTLLEVRLGVPTYLAAVLAVLASGAIGVIFGRPAMRLQGVYLALITLAFTVAVPEIMAFPDDITGGVIGISVIAAGAEFGDIPQLIGHYWLLLAIAAGVVAFGVWAGEGRLGRRWRAVRDSEPGAASIGINVADTKLGAFALSGALGGLSGVMSAIVIGYIAPDSYSVWLSAFLLGAIIIGGRASVLGSLLGSAFVVAIPFMTSTAAVWSQVFFGVAIVIALRFFPSGLAGILRAVRVRITGGARAPSVAQEPS